MRLPILYLHGFASSPRSAKAAFLGERLRARGHAVTVPDLNCGDFSTVTISKMLALAEQGAEALGGPYALIGSSMGGFTAALLASRDDRYLAGLVLLAPAFQPDTLWQRELNPAEIAAWKKTGTLLVEHYGYGKKIPLHRGFLEDASRHPPYPDIGAVPCTIVHGAQDTVVPIALSDTFARGRTNVALHRVDDDHELKRSLMTIDRITEEFLQALVR